MKAPGFGDNRKNQLKDMAIATGGAVSNVLSVFLLQGVLMLFKEENTVHFYVFGWVAGCVLFNVTLTNV